MLAVPNGDIARERQKPHSSEMVIH
jgi:hypothetical protein